MMMCYEEVGGSSYGESLKALEADIQHANALAAAIPKAEAGVCFQMKLVYNHWAPIFLSILQWLDCSSACLLPRYLNLFHILVYKANADGRIKISSHARKATIRDFYAVILPSLQQLHHDFVELDCGGKENIGLKSNGKERLEQDCGFASLVTERDDECGICLDPCAKVVLPNCCHAMCINCYHDWSMRSESCPFCRGTLKRVSSRDLWVLTCKDDVVDPCDVSRENLQRFYLYIRNLPQDFPEAIFFMYYEYLI